MFCPSQNFNSFSSFRQLLFSFFLSVVWLSWNFVRFRESDSFSNRCWKFQLSILKNKKVFFLKKIFFKPLSTSKQKSFVYWPNFQRRFWGMSPNRLLPNVTLPKTWLCQNVNLQRRLCVNESPLQFNFHIKWGQTRNMTKLH